MIIIIIKITRGNKAPDNEPASKKANTMPSPQFYPESPVAAPDPHNHVLFLLVKN